MPETPSAPPSLAPAEPVGVVARVKRLLRRRSRGLALAAGWIGGLSVSTLVLISGLFPDASPLPFTVGLVFLIGTLGLVLSPALFAASHLFQATWSRSSRVAASAQRFLVTRGRREQVTGTRDITLGVVEPRPPGAALRLLLVGGDELVVRVDSVADAEALLEALELDPDQRRLELAWNPLRRRVAAGVLGFVSPFVALASVVGLVANTPLEVSVGLLLLLTPFLGAGVAARAVGLSISLGRDGVHARDALRRVHVDFADVVGGEVGERGITFNMREGPPVRVSLAGLDPSLRGLMAERLRLARERFADRLGSRAEAFARGERGFDEWKRDLVGLLARGSGFRGAALRKEDALRVVEDPNAQADARVGAALALAASASDGERVRVRVAADTSVHPQVRVAIEAALDGDVHEVLVSEALATREF